MAQWLRALATFLGNPGLIDSQPLCGGLQQSVTSGPGDPTPLFDPVGTRHSHDTRTSM